MGGRGGGVWGGGGGVNKVSILCLSGYPLLFIWSNETDARLS